jgi:hypothetical protein
MRSSRRCAPISGACSSMLKECYRNLPGIVIPEVHPRIKAKIETLLDEHRRTENDPDPTWHAGACPATRR